MSKKKKAQAQKDRLKKRRETKANERRIYEGYRDQGITWHRGHSSTRKKGNTIKLRGQHPNGKCGNPGCLKCFGYSFRPFVNRKTGKPQGMPQKMYNYYKIWDRILTAA